MQEANNIAPNAPIENEIAPDAPKEKKQLTDEQVAEIHKVQIIQIKNSLHLKLQEMQRALIEFVHTLPVNQNMKGFAIKHYDEGALWLHEAIRVAELKVQIIDKQEQKPEEKPEENPLPLAAEDQQQTDAA